MGRDRSISGGLVLWKPAGVTSRHALNLVERRLKFRSLGHTGTLDPLASGILVLLGGETRKFQEFLMRRRKVYVARVVLGMGSGSDDSEGPLWCSVPQATMPTREEIEDVLPEFEGEVLQCPPQLSAVRTGGERAYRKVRRGESVEVEPRRVVSHSIRVLEWQAPVLTLEVECGAGYYVRSLARDLGERLGTDGFLAGLRRTQVGSFSEAQAVPLATVERESWLTVEELLASSPRVEVDPVVRDRLSHGQRVPAGAVGAGRRVVWCDHQVLGLAEVKSGVMYPRRWLAVGSSPS